MADFNDWLNDYINKNKDTTTAQDNIINAAEISKINIYLKIMTFIRAARVCFLVSYGNKLIISRYSAVLCLIGQQQ